MWPPEAASPSGENRLAAAAANSPRAKGSLDRRSKWFSLVPFFLQKKKVTRAGGTKLPIPSPQAQFSPPGESQLAAAAANPHPIL